MRTRTLDVVNCSNAIELSRNQWLQYRRASFVGIECFVISETWWKIVLLCVDFVVSIYFAEWKMDSNICGVFSDLANGAR